jgi:hypothetical protein
LIIKIRGHSFAKDIAVRHGISLEQLVQTLKERDILAADFQTPIS